MCCYTREEFEELFDFFLEDDKDSDQENGEESLEEGDGQDEVELPGNKVPGSENKHSCNNEDRLGSFEPDQHGIDDNRHDGDVDKSQDTNVIDDLDEAVHST